jgi:putative tricarboxylic transport membrane protein
VRFELTQRRGQIGVALALLALGLYGIFEASRMPMGTVALPGPGVFPLSLSILLCLAVLGVLAGRFVEGEEPQVAMELVHGPVLLAIAALCGVALLIERAGFLLTITLFLLVLYKAFSTLGWLHAGAAAIVSAVALYVFFSYGIGLALPRGELF